ncbi:threonine--tRNA ligase [Candidatus Falkowbacteria bacterium]|nr:threonine--tRNA ligase [Candidatus Falkowbacteria bacterium]
MDQEYLNSLRHSCAHLLAKAVLTLYPGAHNAIGPSIEYGFYQDFDMGEVKLSDADLPKIEAKMREILPTWKQFTFNEVTLDEAKKLFKRNPYKVELAIEFAGEGKKLTTNDPGDFLDLCKMGHAANPSKEMKHFKLLSVAGAYWRGNEKNKMLTRIYGTCWPTKNELAQYLAMLEEAKKRDHRKLGAELGLFVFSDLVGSGLPLFTPHGTIIRDVLDAYSQELRLRQGFQRVWIPHLTKTELYKISGHWDKFGEELLLVKSQETSDELVLKPMNCPHHQQIYAARMHSYRELPIKYLETTTIYRDEQAGEMLGLSRVRAITQDDSHVFCRPDQIEAVYGMLISIVQEFYGTIGMKLKARLSYRDPEQSAQYLGSSALWDTAQAIIAKVAQEHQLDYYEAIGEAAFYGPKIDFMATDAIGRQWQVATPQLDFVQPQRFGLKYTDADGSDKTPVMIHFALMGSIERFLSVYLEHTVGVFPVWLAPVQVQIISVGADHVTYCQQLGEQLTAEGIRVELSVHNDTVGKKIRNAAKAHVPYMLVIGDKEMNSDMLHVRVRGQDRVIEYSHQDFIVLVLQQIKTRANQL